MTMRAETAVSPGPHPPRRPESDPLVLARQTRNATRVMAWCAAIVIALLIIGVIGGIVEMVALTHAITNVNNNLNGVNNNLSNLGNSSGGL
jgi:predicted PurR-regulated permease PerM